MDPAWLGPIEMGMTFGLFAVFTAWQLWSLRDKGDNAAGQDRPDDEPPKDD